MLLRRVLRKVLRRCLAVGFTVRKGSQKGFLEGGGSRRYSEGRHMQSATPQARALQVFDGG